MLVTNNNKTLLLLFITVVIVALIKGQTHLPQLELQQQENNEESCEQN